MSASMIVDAPSLSSAPHAQSQGKPRHSLFVICEDARGRRYRSRLAVIDVATEPGDHSVALTTAHGVRGRDTCHVHDDTGRQRRVRAKAFGPDPAEDWAVIRFKDFPEGTAHAYALAPQAVPDTAEFSWGRGLLANERSCHLSTHTEERTPGSVTTLHLHDCLSQRGQSGTPLTRGTPSGPLLIGLHTGQAHFLGVTEERPERRYSLYLPMTPERVDAIRRAAETLADD